MAYLLANRWITVLALYLIAAVSMRFAGIADIFPSCIVSKIIGRSCPGCGLTRAGISMLKLDFKAAWNFNPMIFLFVPAALYFLIADIRSFYKKRISETV